VAQISRSELGAKAIANTALLEQVVKHKQVFFPSGWANYDTAKPGSLKLVPDTETVNLLRSDFESMKEMFFGEVESFNSVMTTIRELQEALNLRQGTKMRLTTRPENYVLNTPGLLRFRT
jgi:hypothetical protein